MPNASGSESAIAALLAFAINRIPPLRPASRSTRKPVAAFQAVVAGSVLR